MEWVSASDRPRLFQCGGGTLLLTGLLLRRHNLSRSDQCTPGSQGRFPLFCPRLKNDNADGGALLSANRALVGRWGCGREEGWGSREEQGDEEEEVVAAGVRNVRTRSLGDHSPGSPSVWQLWKFIAIDFVISSLSIGSTWAHWWIARKLFLQSCFFKSTPPPRAVSSVPAVSSSLPSHLLICLYSPITENISL